MSGGTIANAMKPMHDRSNGQGGGFAGYGLYRFPCPALGCHLCRTCQSGKCNWGIATQRPELVARLDPHTGSKRLINLMNAWRHEIKELMGGMGINSIESSGAIA